MRFLEKAAFALEESTVDKGQSLSIRSLGLPLTLIGYDRP